MADRKRNVNSTSIKTPGFERHVRLALAVEALRDERTIARWLRGERVAGAAGEAIARAAAKLGIERRA